MDDTSKQKVLREEAKDLFDQSRGLREAAEDLTAQAEKLSAQGWEKQSAARAIELTIANEKVLTAPDSEFIATEDEREWSVRPYILPFGREYAKWSPFDVDNPPFDGNWLAGMMGIVVLRTDQARTRPTRIIFSSSSGIPHASDKIGQEFEARHDQTGAKLGIYRIVGLVLYSPDGKVARTIGDVGGGSKLSLNTYK